MKGENGWKGENERMGKQKNGKMKEQEKEWIGNWRNGKELVCTCIPGTCEVEHLIAPPLEAGQCSTNFRTFGTFLRNAIQQIGEQRNQSSVVEFTLHKLFQRADKGAKFSLFLLPFLFLFGLFVFCFVSLLMQRKASIRKNTFWAKPIHCNELCTNSVGLISIFRQIGIRQYSAPLP